MVEQNSSIWERLKICWYTLTKKNYAFFAISKDPIIWGDDNKYVKLKEDSIRCYTSISYDYKFISNGKETNLHDFTWKCIEKFSKKAQKGEY